MVPTDINLAFPSVARSTDKEKERIYATTGGVPLQVQSLITHNFNYEDYESDGIAEIKDSLIKLKLELGDAFKYILKSAVGCVLATDGHERYDRKYSVPDSKKKYYYEPVFPLVLTAYQDHFWDEIMEFIDNCERTLLELCKSAETTNDTRGRLFELMVVSRCSNNADLTFEGLDPPCLSKCNRVSRFPTQQLPKTLTNDGMYVPINCNFPAIDLIWKMGQTVFGVQVHVNKSHRNVLDDFRDINQIS
jgi:hypothetical protein